METRSANSILIEAMRKDDCDLAKTALDQRANPDMMIEFQDGGQPLLLSAKSGPMMELLLQYGANPNELSYVIYDAFQTHHFILPHLIFTSPGLAKAMADFRPCKINNQNINSALVRFLEIHKVALTNGTFDWESPEGKAAISLMHISTNLREDATDGEAVGIFHYPDYNNPYSYAIDNNLISAHEIMINHNIPLYKDLIANPPSFFLQPEKTKKFNALVIESDINRYFFKILNAWLILKTYFNSHSEFENFPVEILIYIIRISTSLEFDPLALHYWQENIKQNSKLAIDKLLFGKVYTFLKNHETFSFKNTFWETNKDVPPAQFFSLAHQHSQAHPQGLTAQTLKLIKENKVELLGDDEKFMSCMREHSSVGKFLPPKPAPDYNTSTKGCLFFTTKEEVRENIKQPLGMKRNKLW